MNGDLNGIRASRVDSFPMATTMQAHVNRERLAESFSFLSNLFQALYWGKIVIPALAGIGNLNGSFARGLDN